jgi:hypothetical protein
VSLLAALEVHSGKVVGRCPETVSEHEKVECSHHGSGSATYVCDHLVSKPEQKWFSTNLLKKTSGQIRGVRIVKHSFKSRVVSGTTGTSQKGTLSFFAITATRTCVRGKSR